MGVFGAELAQWASSNIGLGRRPPWNRKETQSPIEVLETPAEKSTGLNYDYEQVYLHTQVELAHVLVLRCHLASLNLPCGVLKMVQSQG